MPHSSSCYVSDDWRSKIGENDEMVSLSSVRFSFLEGNPVVHMKSAEIDSATIGVLHDAFLALSRIRPTHESQESIEVIQLNFNDDESAKFAKRVAAGLSAPTIMLCGAVVVCTK